MSVQPAYLSPEWIRVNTLRHAEFSDYHRMLHIMCLREAARYRTTDTQQWVRLTLRAEQLLTDRQFPRSA